MIIPWPFSPIGYLFGEPSTGVSTYETSFQAPINCSLKLFLSFVFAFIVRSVSIEVRVSILHILRCLSWLSCAGVFNPIAHTAGSSLSSFAPVTEEGEIFKPQSQMNLGNFLVERGRESVRTTAGPGRKPTPR